VDDGVIGRSPSDVDEALESGCIKAGALNASDEFFAKHGAQHPLGVAFTGAQDLLPQDFDEQEALSYIKKIPKQVVRDIYLAGTPDVVIERAAEWRDCGVRYLVLANMGAMQRNMRRGVASVVSFTKVVRRLKRL
jgi:phthiodiolone/phenolphthiodiolone dimycocerosates ketoreductase